MEEQLLQAIRERPDDDGPRLVYADWLSDRGDPRGELIVLQCALARLDRDDADRHPLEARERELMTAHRAEWRRALAAIPSIDNDYLKRGFVERISLDEAMLADHAPAVFAAAPLLSDLYLHASNSHERSLIVPPELARLRAISFASTRHAVAALASPHLRSIERLAFARECQGREIVDALVGSQLDRVESLDLGMTSIERSGLLALTRWAGLARLRRLDLRGCGLAGHLRAFTSSPSISGLRSLNLSDNQLGEAAAIEIVTCEHLATLQELQLDDTNAAGALGHATLSNLRKVRYGRNPMSAADGRAIAEQASLASVERLELEGRNLDAPTIHADAALAIVASSRLASLTAIDLQQNWFGKRGAAILAAMRGGFRELGLSYTRFGAEAARALADNPGAASIVKLDLSSNVLDPTTVERLAASPHLRPRTLVLSYTELGHRGLAPLAASSVLSEVRCLELTGCKLDDEAIATLARSPHVGRLARLILYNNPIDEAAAIALAASPYLRPLIELNLGATRVGAPGRTVLAAVGHAVR